MTIERWQTFSKHDQLLNIGAEILRASLRQDKDAHGFSFAVRQALNFVNLTLEDAKWREQKHMLIWLQKELKKFLTGAKKESIGILYRAL